MNYGVEIKKMFKGDGYVRDMLRSYGDRGQPMQLPEYNAQQFRNAVQYRGKERADYFNALAELDSMRAELNHVKQLNSQFADFVNANFSPFKGDVATDHGRGSSDSGGGQRDRVVPAVQGATAAGEAEQVAFSKPQVDDEPSVSRGSRSGDDVPDVPGAIEEVSTAAGDTADAGGSDSTPGPRAPDARRQGSEHDSEE